MLVYTAAFGTRTPQPPPNMPQCRFVCFTDRCDLDGIGWQIRKIDTGGTPARAARQVKMQPHLYFSDASITMWIDANLQLTKIPDMDADCMAFAHPVRTCVYNELDRIAKGKITDNETCERIAHYFQSMGCPPHAGLYACGVLVRKNTAINRAFGEAWWHLANRLQFYRDQPTFGYLTWLTRLPIAQIQGNILGNNPYVLRRPAM